MSWMIGLGVITNASAATYIGNLEYVAGTGSNHAIIAVDFDFEHYFLFTYYWDGDATGWDALNGIDLAGGLEVEATDWGEWGMFVDNLSYSDAAKHNYGEGSNTGWAYYVGDNENWSLYGNGVSFRPLSDGDWDSWVWTNYDASWHAVRGPGEQPVPEPSTLALLALGAPFIKRRRG